MCDNTITTNFTSYQIQYTDHRNGRTCNTHLLCILYLFCRNAYQSMITELLSRNSAGIGLDGQGSIPGRGKNFFSTSQRSRPALGPTQPPIQWLPRFLPGVKRLRREADHSFPLMNGGAIPPLAYRSSRRCAELITHRANFLCDYVLPLSLPGNGSVNTFLRQRIHMQQ
jgi:hypothetical protein